jgi:stage V sporulation protein D (sporulation-specific penicillin-binding protein)
MVDDQSATVQSVQRIKLWHIVLMAVFALFVMRAFYVQIIRYDFYRTSALSDQLKQYEIPAARGTIMAQDGSQTVPLVLNQRLYTVYADPLYIKDPTKAAQTVSDALGGDSDKYQKGLGDKSRRYVILAKKVSKEQKDKLLAHKIPGIAAQELAYRTYPQGALGAQLLGFVNEAGDGKYGIEETLNKKLAGKPGELRAITDVSGVPLAASGSNVESQPVSGQNVALTIDIGIQRNVEQILEKGVKAKNGVSGSAVVLDPHTGAIKAMANYPSYDPANYSEVEDGKLFNNESVSHPIEIGSIMKSLTTAAALDKGVIKQNTTYYDPAHYEVDKFKITNIEEDGGAGTRSIAQLLDLSLNTGAVWELMQMGGGQINKQARETWYDYMYNHYMFGKSTGVEQSYEATGDVPKPQDNGAAINLTYANTAFGQGMTATTLQAAGAMAAVINGGTYYKPHLIAAAADQSGTMAAIKPQVEKSDVVSPATSKAMIPLLQYVIDNHNFKPAFDQDRYMVGGKTGTAQIAKPNGGYYENDFNGTYLGFVGGDQPDYIIAVFINKPVIAVGYAGTAAAQPVFADIGHMLIDNGYVIPKK